MTLRELWDAKEAAEKRWTEMHLHLMDARSTDDQFAYEVEYQKAYGEMGRTAVAFSTAAQKMELRDA